jgi:excisionase family DNA binding protein
MALVTLIDELERRQTLMNTPELMTLLGKTRGTICSLVRQGSLVAIRIGGSYRFDPRVVAAFLRDHCTAPSFLHP